jgi:DNA-binding HxlR family transcriptional regulator
MSGDPFAVDSSLRGHLKNYLIHVQELSEQNRFTYEELAREVPRHPEEIADDLSEMEEAGILESDDNDIEFLLEVESTQGFNEVLENTRYTKVDYGEILTVGETTEYRLTKDGKDLMGDLDLPYLKDTFSL